MFMFTVDNTVLSMNIVTIILLPTNDITTIKYY